MGRSVGPKARTLHSSTCLLSTSTQRSAGCVLLAVLACGFGYATVRSDSAVAQSIAPSAAPSIQPESTSPTPPLKQRDVVDGAPLSPNPLSPSNGVSAKDSTSAPATPSAEVTDKRTLDEAFAGIVADQVTTIIAQNFYGYFVSAWRDMPLASRYNVSIHERPSARWGSLVWVEFEHRRLFEVFLSPARMDIRAAGERAAAVAYQNLVRTDLERLLFHDKDLGPDEL